jgi:ABC-type antimicrobial peptide transport system permease subunit
LISTTIVTDGHWHRVGFVRNSIERILYVDDVEVACDTAENLRSTSGELYIRMALGATQGNITGMVVREGLMLTMVGLMIGLGLGLAVARVAARFLYRISPIDPVSIMVTVVLLGAASLLAGYVPARRAAKIDPMKALRYE